MSKLLKIGVLGAGRIGRLHTNNIVHNITNAEVVAIADPFLSDEADKWAKDLNIEKRSKNPDDIINDKEIDAVFICTSTASHADLIIQAAQAGKQIFCEKPIHTDIKKIEAAISAVEKTNVKLQVGFVRRFDHNHKKVHDVVASGKLGAPHIIKITSRDPELQSIEYIATSGGIFMDMTIHDFDMARYLAQSEVEEVFVYGSRLLDPRIAKYNDVDTVIIALKFENGAVGVIDNSRATGYGYDQRTEVHCEKGCVQVGNDLENTSMISTAEGVEIAKPTWFFLERYNDAFISEEKAFINMVLNDTESPVGPHDGLMPVKIAKAAQKSFDEGRPVKISEI